MNRNIDAITAEQQARRRDIKYQSLLGFRGPFTLRDAMRLIRRAERVHGVRLSSQAEIEEFLRSLVNNRDLRPRIMNNQWMWEWAE